MRIELDDPSRAPELLHFLRERGCIAYVLDDTTTIEVIEPESSSTHEMNRLDPILKTWRTRHPEIGFTLTE
jgi:hypothetical protein